MTVGGHPAYIDFISASQVNVQVPANVSLGTPAPVFPTRRLVVTGLYRYVRNPMYVTVVITIIGQGLILGNLRLLEYSAVVWLPAHLFVLVYEEPTLRASFGSEYKSYCAEVPRWIPRLTPWRNDLEKAPRSHGQRGQRVWRGLRVDTILRSKDPIILE